MGARRYTSLDGMRGLLAVLVVLIHASLVAPFFDPDRSQGPAALLQMNWLGTAALMSFFVMSGFVLTLPFTRGVTLAGWLVYYPQRLLRLYPPVLVAVVLAAVLVALFPRGTVDDASGWLNLGHVHTYTDVRDVLDDVALIGPVEPGRFLSPLWSLRWEVYFSLLLPLYLWVSWRFRRHALALCAGALMVVALSDTIGGNFARYLPVFALGSLLAVRFDDVEALAGRLRTRDWAAVGVAALMLASLGWWVPMSDAAAYAFQDVAAVLVVCGCLFHPGIERMCTSAVATFLGKISYSLYLVHELVIVNLAFAFDITDPVLMMALSLPLSVLAGWAFFAVVEHPSHTLSRSTARRVRRLVGGRAAASASPAHPDTALSSGVTTPSTT